jgi:hypothetical protein
MKMLFMVTETWPHKSTAEFARVAAEALSKTPPPYIKSSIYATTSDDGMKVYVLHEIEEGHEVDAFIEVVKIYAPYFGIEGWGFTVEPLLSPREAILLIEE